MILDIFLVVVGLAILIAGAEGLVRGASSIAAKLNISPLVIGLTIVAFGTSTPELTVNIAAALGGSPDLAIGNIVGSNIANILLILGVCAVIAPLTVKSSTVWKEIPLALLAVVLLFAMGNDRLFDGLDFTALTRTDGIVLMSLMAIFMYYIIGMAMREKQKAAKKSEPEDIKIYSLPQSSAFFLAGLAGLVIGGKVLVDAAVSISQAAGLSETLIGLTVVGIGTSLPELATSVVATLRKQTDIAIGNVVGSNIFNVFWVLGLTATVLQLPFSPAVSFDVLVAIAATALLFGLTFMGRKHFLDRTEGAIFLTLFVVYMTYIVQRG